MLGFKFIDTLGEQDLTGPVPLFGVFGGDKHKAVITSNNIFNRATFTAILEQNTLDSPSCATTNIVFQDNANLSLTGSVNLLTDTELISYETSPDVWDVSGTWSYNGTANLNTIELSDGEGDDLMESVIYSSPAKKLEKQNGNPVSNSNLKSTFVNELDEYYTFSIFLSYGDMTDSPATGQPTTTLKIDDSASNTGAQATLNIRWNSDGTIDTVSNTTGNGYVSSGYDTIKVGGRTWYHIYLTNKMKVSSGTGNIFIWPCGWVDTGGGLVPAVGHIYLCHPQVEKGKYYTSYVPQYSPANHDDISLPSVIAGQGSTNMVAAIASDQIVFDIESNTPITNFSKGRNKIYLSDEDYYSKKLVYRDKDFTGRKLRLLKAYPRFPVAWKSDKLVVSELTTPTVTVRQQAEHRTQIHVPIRDNKHSWKINIKKEIDIVDNTIVRIHGGQPRNKKVWNEKPKYLSSKLVEVSEKGLANWTYSTNAFSDTGYYVKTASNCSIILNYDIKVTDIDKERGLILFEHDIPEDLKISYCLDDTWAVIPIELNPLLNKDIPNKISIKINDRGHILYEVDGDGVLLSNGTEFSQELGIYETYQSIAIASMEWTKPEIIDLRREGGMLLNKDSEDYSLRDHTVFGFMGVDPKQLHVSIVRMPDKALENLIYQFEESHFQYDEDNPFTYPLDWESNRETYINFISATAEEIGQSNQARDELFLYCKRHMPAGIRLAITDKHDNLIGIN